MTVYVPKSEQFKHQRDDLAKMWSREGYAWFWEQGTGKSKEFIDNAGMLWAEGEIGGAFLLAPNGLHRNFITKEIPKHLPDDMAEQGRSMFWRTDRADAKWHQQEARSFLAHRDGLSFLSMSYDGLMTESGRAFAKEFLKSRRCLYGLDESARIKEPKTDRTVRVLTSAPYAPYRRVMTGTPIATRPWDIWTQIKFADESFWSKHGLGDFESMKTQFGVWGEGRRRVSIAQAINKRTGEPKWGYEVPVDEEGNHIGIALQKFPQLARDDRGRPQYKNLDLLRNIVSTIRTRVLKADVFDLPPKLYSKVEFPLSPQQRSAYAQMRKLGFALIEGGGTCSASMALTVLLRLQQIACGYLVHDLSPELGEDPVIAPFRPNPRLDLLGELTLDLDHQAIIWARFTPDVDQICELLKKQGKTVARYDGLVSDDERAKNEERYHRGEAQFFVSKQSCGGEGLTLTETKSMFYYSNSFSLIHRLQSEDRPHRYGLKWPLNIIDIVALDTIDVGLLDNLQGKFDVASMVTGDQLKSWLAPAGALL